MVPKVLTKYADAGKKDPRAMKAVKVSCPPRQSHTLFWRERGKRDVHGAAERFGFRNIDPAGLPLGLCYFL